jgi:hypothetical protein
MAGGTGQPLLVNVADYDAKRGETLAAHRDAL